MKKDDIVVCFDIKHNRITIDKINYIGEGRFYSSYVDSILRFYNSNSSDIKDYICIDIFDYLNDPQKWNFLYEKHDLIIKMLSTFIQNLDLVEARKIKLKLLNEL